MDEFNPWLPNENPLVVFDWEEVFENDHPVEIDLGAGDGDFVIAYAQKYPERNFVAVERLLGRARKIVKRAKKFDLRNVRVMRIESHYFIERMCRKNSIGTIHIMCPDPWPKNRHHKRRLIQSPFIQTAQETLRKGGEVRFTTDHEEYFRWTRQMWEQEKDWEKLGEWDMRDYPQSEFERMFLEQEKPIYRCAWKKL